MDVSTASGLRCPGASPKSSSSANEPCCCVDVHESLPLPVLFTSLRFVLPFYFPFSLLMFLLSFIPLFLLYLYIFPPLSLSLFVLLLFPFLYLILLLLLFLPFLYLFPSSSSRFYSPFIIFSPPHLSHSNNFFPHPASQL